MTSTTDLPLRKRSDLPYRPFVYLYRGRYITVAQAMRLGRIRELTLRYRLKVTGGDMEAALDKWVDRRCRVEE